MTILYKSLHAVRRRAQAGWRCIPMEISSMPQSNQEYTMKIQTLMTALLLAASGAAFAQATPGVDQAQARQEKRIEQGVASGQLNGKETVRLEKREGKLAAHELMAKSDGKVTPRERLKLRAEAQRDSHAIYRQKHDRQVAPVAK